jgi:hypothetical protein
MAGAGEGHWDAPFNGDRGSGGRMKTLWTTCGDGCRAA